MNVYSRPLTEKLKPIEEALARLELPDVDGHGTCINPDLDVVLRGLLDVVRTLAQHRWSEPDGPE